MANLQSMLFATAVRFITVRAFDPGKAGWKLTADGKTVEMKDGNPIWIDATGNESTLSGDTITRLNNEARDLRVAKEQVEGNLAKYKEIPDPVAAKKALDTVKNIDAKRLIDAGEVERVKEEIKAGFQTQLTEAQTTNAKLQQDFDGLKIDNVFAQSQFIREQVAVPHDMFQATFRSQFKIKDGKLEAFDKAGNRIMSKAKIGEFADPDEALELLVGQHPQKDTILKAPNASGSGNNGAGGYRGGKRTILRADFDKLGAAESAATAIAAGKGEIVIVDPT